MIYELTQICPHVPYCTCTHLTVRGNSIGIVGGLRARVHNAFYTAAGKKQWVFFDTSDVLKYHTVLYYNPLPITPHIPHPFFQSLVPVMIKEC